MGLLDQGNGSKSYLITRGRWWIGGSREAASADFFFFFLIILKKICDGLKDGEKSLK